MQDFFILLVIFSVPLAFIGSRTFLKYKQLELDAGRGSSAAGEKRLRELERANAELQERIETLETIATGGDHRSSGLEGARKLKELEAQVQGERVLVETATAAKR